MKPVTFVTTSLRGFKFTTNESVQVRIYVTTSEVLVAGKTVLSAETKCVSGSHYIGYTEMGMKKMPSPGTHYLHIIVCGNGELANSKPATKRVEINQEVVNKFAIDGLKHDISKMGREIKSTGEIIGGLPTTSQITELLAKGFENQLRAVDTRIADLVRKGISESSMMKDVEGMGARMVEMKGEIEKLTLKVNEVEGRPIYEAPKPLIPPLEDQPQPPPPPPTPPVLEPTHTPAPGNQPKGCLFWKRFWKFWPWALLGLMLFGAMVLVVFMLCLMHASSSQNANAFTLIGNSTATISNQTVVTNIIAPTPEPSACERAREDRKIEALTQATRNLDRWQHNQFLLDEKRRKEQEKTEQVQPAPTIVNVYATQAAPAPATIINQTFVTQSVRGSDTGCGEVRSYPRVVYPPVVYLDQEKRDHDAWVSAKINAGVQFNLGGGLHFGFGNNGGCVRAIVR